MITNTIPDLSFWHKAFDKILIFMGLLFTDATSSCYQCLLVHVSKWHGDGIRYEMKRHAVEYPVPVPSTMIVSSSYIILLTDRSDIDMILGYYNRLSSHNSTYSVDRDWEVHLESYVSGYRCLFVQHHRWLSLTVSSDEFSLLGYSSHRSAVNRPVGKKEM